MNKLSLREQRIIVDRPRLEIAQLYGSGVADQTSQRNLAYHNLPHTINVDEASVRLAGAVGLHRAGVVLARSAANNHDRRQLGDRNELVSAELAANDLRELAIDETSVGMVELAIAGTEVRFDKGRMIQKAVEQEYPTKMHEKLAHILASADLGLTYTPWGPYLSHLLFQEMCELRGEQPDVAKLLDFQISQVDFMQKYRYPDSEHDRILSTHKSEVMHYVFKLIRQLEDGVIESWQDLLDQDIAFAHSLSN